MERSALLDPRVAPEEPPCADPRRRAVLRVADDTPEPAVFCCGVRLASHEDWRDARAAVRVAQRDVGMGEVWYGDDRVEETPGELWERLALAGLIAMEDVSHPQRRFGWWQEPPWGTPAPPTNVACVEFATRWPDVLAAEALLRQNGRFLRNRTARIYCVRWWPRPTCDAAVRAWCERNGREHVGRTPPRAGRLRDNLYYLRNEAAAAAMTALGVVVDALDERDGHAYLSLWETAALAAVDAAAPAGAPDAAEDAAAP